MLLASFFSALERVKAEINDDKQFRLFCIDHLGVSLDDIVRVSSVLSKVDSARIKKEFAAARKADRKSKRKKVQLLLLSDNRVLSTSELTES